MWSLSLFLLLAACGTTSTVEDPGELCLSWDGVLYIDSGESLRYGCKDEVLSFPCEVTHDGELLQVSGMLEVYEGAQSCSAYDDSFDVMARCDVPDGMEGEDLEYAGETLAWSDLAECP